MVNETIFFASLALITVLIITLAFVVAAWVRAIADDTRYAAALDALRRIGER